MSPVVVHKIRNSQTALLGVLDAMGAITESIQKPAFNTSGSRCGADQLDWLQAERDVVLSPHSELLDEEREFGVRVALPGFEADDVRMSTVENVLVIQGNTGRTNEEGGEKSGHVAGQILFRMFVLPPSVDVGLVTASLAQGILKVTAPKSGPKQMTSGT